MVIIISKVYTVALICQTVCKLLPVAIYSTVQGLNGFTNIVLIAKAACCEITYTAGITLGFCCFYDFYPLA